MANDQNQGQNQQPNQKVLANLSTADKIRYAQLAQQYAIEQDMGSPVGNNKDAWIAARMHGIK